MIFANLKQILFAFSAILSTSELRRNQIVSGALEMRGASMIKATFSLSQRVCNSPLSGTRLSIFTLHSSKISLATARISFQSLIMSSLVVRVEVTVNLITYLPFKDAGTA